MGIDNPGDHRLEHERLAKGFDELPPVDWSKRPIDSKYQGRILRLGSNLVTPRADGSNWINLQVDIPKTREEVSLLEGMVTTAYEQIRQLGEGLGSVATGTKHSSVADLPDPKAYAGKLATVTTGLGDKLYVADSGSGWQPVALFRPRQEAHVYLDPWGGTLLGDYVPVFDLADENTAIAVRWRNGMVTVDANNLAVNKGPAWEDIADIRGQIIARNINRKQPIYDSTGNELGLAWLRPTTGGHLLSVKANLGGTTSFGFTVPGDTNPTLPTTKEDTDEP